jgi:hypothetical protein
VIDFGYDVGEQFSLKIQFYCKFINEVDQFQIIELLKELAIRLDTISRKNQLNIINFEMSTQTTFMVIANILG